ncbi:MAG: magnesium chelatase subunit D [Paracoccaceae bacterium]|nr:magnesium chelatase subunit D [Paracoccaceae bacterium]
MADPTEAWVTGQLALSLLAVDPDGLRGMHLRARAGTVRDGFLTGLPEALSPMRRIAPGISDTQLFGGIDIAGTLAAGRVVRSSGLLATGQPLMLTMAERVEAELAAKLAQALDSGALHTLILLDEGVDADEIAPHTLRERLAFSLDLHGLRAMELTEIALEPTDIADARRLLPAVEVSDETLARLTVAAAQFGIDSLRAPLLALRAARAHAALSRRKAVSDDDLTIAAQLVYGHRATVVPQESEEQAEPEPETNHPEESGQDQDNQQTNELELPDELLIEAVKALLPPDLLHALSQPGGAKGSKGAGGAGKKHKGNRRGRPLPSRPGHPGGDKRIDIVATLRAAAPWQPIRRQAQPDATGILIRPSDIHIRRFQELSDRLIIFVVDASGSSAVARMAEAKGAIEMMLAEAYARRDHVALIAFRGDGAELLLPPTRSLVQTKRRLAGLPGGGGTPLAAGLQAAADLAQRAMRQGLSPSIALLTDGRANVALPGRSGRAAAREDAEQMARVLRAMNLPSAAVDTSVRPQAELKALAATLGATYVPLPRADAAGLSRAIDTALER